MAAYTGPPLEMRTLERELELMDNDVLVRSLTPAQREFYDIIHPPTGFLIQIFNDNIRTISQVYLSGPVPPALDDIVYRGENVHTRKQRKDLWGIETIISHLLEDNWVPQTNQQLAAQLRNSIDNQLAQAGYVFHYFEYVKADVTQIQAMRGELVLNPQNFENGSISILPVNFYQPTLNNLRYDDPMQKPTGNRSLIGKQLPNIKVYWAQ